MFELTKEEAYTLLKKGNMKTQKKEQRELKKKIPFWIWLKLRWAFSRGNNAIILLDCWHCKYEEELKKAGYNLRYDHSIELGYTYCMIQLEEQERS